MEDSFATEVVLSPTNSDSDDSDYSPRTRKARPKSTSFIAVRDAVYQLTCLNDFTRERIGGGFFAEVYKVTCIINLDHLLSNFLLSFFLSPPLSV